MIKNRYPRQIRRSRGRNAICLPQRTVVVILRLPACLDPGCHRTQGQTGCSPGPPEPILHPGEACLGSQDGKPPIYYLQRSNVDLPRSLPDGSSLWAVLQADPRHQTQGDCRPGLYELGKLYLYLAGLGEHWRRACLYQLQLEREAVDTLCQSVDSPSADC